jgi:hypothetical protein
MAGFLEELQLMLRETESIHQNLSPYCLSTATQSPTTVQPSSSAPDPGV